MFENLQINTENKSCHELSTHLIKEGFGNTTEIIYSLLDKDLLFVDPYSQNLSNKMKSKIIEECRNNPFYYFREILNFSFDKFLLAVLISYKNDISAWTSKSRQLYSTSTLIHLLNYRRLFFHNSINFASINKNSSNLLKRKIIKLSNNLPSYIQDLENTNKINTSHDFFNYDYVLFDDAEFIKDIELIFEFAKSNRKFKGIYFNSTINDNFLMVEKLEEIPKWSDAMFVDVNLQEYLSKYGMIHINYPYNLLFDDEKANKYLTEKAVMLNNDPEIIRRELDLKRL